MQRTRPVYLLPLLVALLVALGLSARPHGAVQTPVPQGPRGVAVPDTLDLGRLAADAQLDAEVPWERVGPGPVRVLDVRTDCGCAVVRPLPKILAEQACGRLPVRIRVGSRVGPFSVRVRIVSAGDPPADVATCRLRGYVDQPLRGHPAALALGRRSAGAALERRVELRWYADAADPDVHTRLSGVDGSITVGPPASRSHPGALLTLQLHAPTQPGPLRAHLMVEVAGVGELLVPITGDVVGPGR